MRWVKVVKWRAFSFSKIQKRKKKKEKKTKNQREQYLNKQYVHVWSSIISTCPPCFPLFHPPQMAKNPGLFFYKHHYFPRYKSRAGHALIGWVRTSPSLNWRMNRKINDNIVSPKGYCLLKSMHVFHQTMELWWGSSMPTPSPTSCLCPVQTNPIVISTILNLSITQSPGSIDEKMVIPGLFTKVRWGLWCWYTSILVKESFSHAT